MRLLHTSDWHLGQEFHGFTREHEHQAFLDWLEDALEEHAVNALVVAGDIYDSQNPPISAQRQLYRFLSRARRRLPDLDVVLVGGNHDSAGRLEAPRPLLEEFGVHVVGSLPRIAGRPDIDRLTIPLHNRHGEVAALCAAVPFLRLPDLPAMPADTPEDALVWGVRQVYVEVLNGVAARLAGGQSLIATGHCYMTGCALSDLSERRILGGNQHALPDDIFGDRVAYAALGHLHKAQRVGGRETVRYCGSPLPLSVTEHAYRHQVLLVDLDGGQATVTPLPVPRLVDILRIPASGAAPADAVLPALRALPAQEDLSFARQPYLDVVVSAGGPTPGLRRDVEEAIRGKGVRLARLKVEQQTVDRDAPALSAPDLEDLDPEDVFLRCWARSHPDAPPQATLDAFRELLETLDHEAEAAQ